MSDEPDQGDKTPAGLMPSVAKYANQAASTVKSILSRKKADQPEKPIPPEQVKFVSLLKLSINQKFAEVLAAKQGSASASVETDKKKRRTEDDPAFITLLDATTITNYVRGVFTNRLGLVPPPVEAALVLSEITVTPSTITKIKMFKRAVGLAGGLAGIGLIAMSIMTALGVGTATTAPAIWASIVAWWTGTVATAPAPHLLPVTIALGGAGVAAFAVYFSASGSAAERAEKFRNALVASCEKAVAGIWDEYGSKLS